MPHGVYWIVLSAGGSTKNVLRNRTRSRQMNPEIEKLIDAFYPEHLKRHGRAKNKRLHPTREEYSEIFLTGWLAKVGMDEIEKDGGESAGIR
jgi:hypothetical protein